MVEAFLAEFREMQYPWALSGLVKFTGLVISLAKSRKSHLCHMSRQSQAPS